MHNFFHHLMKMRRCDQFNIKKWNMTQLIALTAQFHPKKTRKKHLNTTFITSQYCRIAITTSQGYS